MSAVFFKTRGSYNGALVGILKQSKVFIIHRHDLLLTRLDPSDEWTGKLSANGFKIVVISTLALDAGLG